MFFATDSAVFCMEARMKSPSAWTAVLVPLATLVLLTGCSSDPGRSVTHLPQPVLCQELAIARPAARPIVAKSIAKPRQDDSPWAIKVPARNWKYIIIHHSATEAGSARIFDRAHRARGWDELGYHFVITNGDGGRDGEIQIGSRWGKQKWGAHCKTPDNRYNDYGIGICLVGNFDEGKPSRAQLASLTRLIKYLAETYQIPASEVMGHGEAEGTCTRCPGGSLLKVLRRIRSQLPDSVASK
jgi:hypothetical protein